MKVWIYVQRDGRVSHQSKILKHKNHLLSNTFRFISYYKFITDKNMNSYEPSYYVYRNTFRHIKNEKNKSKLDCSVLWQECLKLKI